MKIFTKENTLTAKHRFAMNRYDLNYFFLFYRATELDVIKKFNANFSITVLCIFFFLLLPLTVFDIAKSLINAPVPSTNNFCALSNF